MAYLSKSVPKKPQTTLGVLRQALARKEIELNLTKANVDKAVGIAKSARMDSSTRAVKEAIRILAYERNQSLAA